MTVVQKIDRRGAQRFQASFNIRFSINGGPEILSNTLNFTSRSLAIRSDVKAAKGDRVAVFFGGLPVIEGEVARVFPEGFAVVLSEASLAMMAHTDERAEIAAQRLGFNVEPVTSPFIHVCSDIRARALITSSVNDAPGHTRHFLSIITADPARLDKISAIWLSADGTRWTANALRLDHRHNRGIAVMALNDWQAHMGAAYGLKISIIDGEQNEWSLDIDADQIAGHLEMLPQPEPFKMAVNA